MGILSTINVPHAIKNLLMTVWSAFLLHGKPFSKLYLCCCAFVAALWRTSSIWLGNTERSTQTDQNGYRKAIIDLLSRHIFASLVRVVLPHSGHNAEDKLNHKATSNGSFSGRMRQTPPHIQLPLSATPTQQLTIAAMNTYIPHHSSCCVNHVVTFLGRCT